MSEQLELIRRLDALWIPGTVIAALVVLLILWEIALLLGVHVVLKRGNHAGDETVDTPPF